MTSREVVPLHIVTRIYIYIYIYLQTVMVKVGDVINR
jgi:hypothetical protein